MPLLPVLLASCLSFPAFAGDASSHDAGAGKGSSADCTVTAGKDDRLAQGKDLRLEPDARVKEAVALHGNVVVPRGATVEKAVAVDGSVILEPGAKVTGEVTALGGDVKVGENAEIGGDATALGGRLEIAPSAVVKGGRHSLSLHVDGDELVREFVEKTMPRDRKCRVERKD